ncbi:MAG: hypothetical protein ACD_20C00150G0009 [uncultured bacterium]|nr:MAG: hypothetical protein ACD_20C00150G0009 [uncultured bacterium]
MMNFGYYPNNYNMNNNYGMNNNSGMNMFSNMFDPTATQNPLFGQANNIFGQVDMFLTQLNSGFYSTPNPQYNQQNNYQQPNMFQQQGMTQQVDQFINTIGNNTTPAKPADNTAGTTEVPVDKPDAAVGTIATPDNGTAAVPNETPAATVTAPVVDDLNTPVSARQQQELDYLASPQYQRNLQTKMQQSFQNLALLNTAALNTANDPEAQTLIKNEAIKIATQYKSYETELNFLKANPAPAPSANAFRNPMDDTLRYKIQECISKRLLLTLASPDNADPALQEQMKLLETKQKEYEAKLSLLRAENSTNFAPAVPTNPQLNSLFQQIDMFALALNNPNGNIFSNPYGNTTNNPYGNPYGNTSNPYGNPYGQFY